MDDLLVNVRHSPWAGAQMPTALIVVERFGLLISQAQALDEKLAELLWIGNTERE